MKTQNNPDGLMRINRWLASCNAASRRQADELIKQGMVQVNGQICTDLSTRINPVTDVVTVNGKPLEAPQGHVYIMLNKPPGYLVSAKDDFDRRTIFKLLPDLGVHMFAVGRLDLPSEGLLLVTSDGDFAQKVIHPRSKLPKVYRVTVKGNFNVEQVEKMRKLTLLDGLKVTPAIVHVKKRSDDFTQLRITIFEGRKRQIRRLVELAGGEVTVLKRVSIGGLELGSLPRGMWRPLKPNEILGLLKQSGSSKKFKNKEDKR